MYNICTGIQCMFIKDIFKIYKSTFYFHPTYIQVLLRCVDLITQIIIGIDNHKQNARTRNNTLISLKPYYTNAMIQIFVF